MHAMRAVQNMFVKMAENNQVQNLNPYFVDTMNTCVSKVLETDLIQKGYSTNTHDAINDIT
jgi:hypothetical protein